MYRRLISLWGRFVPNPSYYGWVIVGMGFLCSALTSPGQSFILSLYLEPVMGEVGLSRMEISSLFALTTLAAAACLPFVGRVADRVPSGVFLGAVVIFLGAAMVGLSLVHTVTGLAISLFLLRLLGLGAMGLGSITAAVRWFKRYRGRAVAVVGLGYAFGQLVYPGVVYSLMDALGWRGSLLALAAAYLFLAGPLTIRLVRERHSADGPLDGEPAAAAPEVIGLPGVDTLSAGAEHSFSVGTAMRTPIFWGLLAGVVVLPLAQTAVVFHQVALFTSLGWGPGLVPTAFAVYALGGVVMAYLGGLLLERHPSRYVLSGALAFSALAFAAVALPVMPFYGALLYAALLGISAGMHSASSTFVWADYFGIEALGAVRGVVSSATAGGTAVGPLLAALLLTPEGSFAPALGVFGVICALGAVLSLRLRKPVVGFNRREPTDRRVPLAA